MTNVADAAPVSGQTEPPARPSFRDHARPDGDRSPPVRHAHRPRRDPARRSTSLSGGKFFQPTNMITLAVQASGVAIIATGMVLDHRVPQHRPVGRFGRRLDRHDLRPADDRLVAQLLGHRRRLPVPLGDRPGARASALGALIGAVQGFIIAYVGVPSFIVTLGGLLSIRGVVWYISSGAAVSGLDPTFQLIGGGAAGLDRRHATWVVGARRLHGDRGPAHQRPPPTPAVRLPASADVGRGRSRRRRAAARVLGVAAFANANLWPQGLAERIALEQNWGPAPAGGWRSRPGSRSRSSC